jgi:hypothetical protein
MAEVESRVQRLHKAIVGLLGWVIRRGEFAPISNEAGAALEGVNALAAAFCDSGRAHDTNSAAAGGVVPPAPTPTPRAEPATKKAVRSLLHQQNGKGLFGKKIVAALREQGIIVKLKTIQRHYLQGKNKIPGVKNHRARGGYYIEPIAAQPRATPRA